MLALALKRLNLKHNQATEIQSVVLLRGKVMSLHARYQIVHVKRGMAWVTLNGKDYALFPGDEIVLVPQDGYPATISAMGSKPAVLSVQQGGKHG